MDPMNGIWDFTNNLIEVNEKVIAFGTNLEKSVSDIGALVGKVTERASAADGEIAIMVWQGPPAAVYPAERAFPGAYAPVAATGGGNYYSDLSPAMQYRSPDTPNNVLAARDSQQGSGAQGNKAIGMANSAAELVDGGVEIYELAGGKVPEKFKLAVKAVKTITNAFKSAGEIAEGIDAAASGTALAESAAAVAETGTLLAGAEGIAAASALFGPPGWIAAGVISAGVIGYGIYEDINKKNEEQAKLIADSQEQMEQQQRMRTLPSFAMPNRKALMTYVYSDNESKAYPAPKIMHSDYDLTSAIAATFGPGTRSLDPMAPVYSRMPGPPLNPFKQEPGWVVNPLIESNEAISKLTKVGSEGGRGALDAAIQAERTKARNTKDQRTIGFTDIALTEVESNFVNQANEGRYDPDTQQQAFARAPLPIRERPSASSAVTINLNKPMIEHFTVNAKELHEGVNEFKQKVEEVLLEILKNVNTH